MWAWPKGLSDPRDVAVPMIRDGIDMTDFAGMFDGIISQFTLEDGNPLPTEEVERVRQEATEYFQTTTGLPASFRLKKPRKRA